MAAEAGEPAPVVSQSNELGRRSSNNDKTTSINAPPVVDTNGYQRLPSAPKLGLKETGWNTKNLSGRLMGDAGAAAAAGGLVAPVITVIDK